MTQQPKLDDKYRTGIWYDEMSGDFCQIREVDDTIGLFNPRVENFDEQGPYFTFDEIGGSVEDAIDTINADMRRVPNAAVESPVEYLHEILDAVGVNNRKLTEEDKRGLMYARRQVQIREV